MHKSNPDIQHFGLLLFAGHGMIRDGVQCFVLNEFHKAVGYYKLDAVETNIRGISNQCKNGYIVGIFACCREIFVTSMHTNCFGADSKQDAQKQFDAKDAAEKLEAEEKQSLQDKYDKLVEYNKELKELLKVQEEY